MRRRARPVIALLTDFGTRDWYVAQMKGVLLSRAPSAQLIDITHEISPHDILGGAFALAAALPWLPRGTVALAVVDPGVGTSRALLAAAIDDRFVVGPDNGLLSLVLARARRKTMVRLANPHVPRRRVSRTFHGRDWLAPAAAYLAAGGSLRRLGPTVRTVHELSLPAVVAQGRGVRGAVLHIDHFGNLITNLEAARWRRDRRGSGMIRYRGRSAAVVSSYADAPPGVLVALVGSLGFWELAVRDASAAQRFHAKRGDAVTLARSAS